MHYIVLDLLARFAPYQAVRKVYSELLRQFFWANAFRGMMGDLNAVNAIYEPQFDELVKYLEQIRF